MIDLLLIRKSINYEYLGIFKNYIKFPFVIQIHISISYIRKKISILCLPLVFLIRFCDYIGTVCSVIASSFRPQRNICDDSPKISEK